MDSKKIEFRKKNWPVSKKESEPGTEVEARTSSRVQLGEARESQTVSLKSKKSHRNETVNL